MLNGIADCGRSSPAMIDMRFVNSFSFLHRDDFSCLTFFISSFWCTDCTKCLEQNIITRANGRKEWPSSLFPSIWPSACSEVEKEKIILTVDKRRRLQGGGGGGGWRKSVGERRPRLASHAATTSVQRERNYPFPERQLRFSTEARNRDLVCLFLCRNCQPLYVYYSHDKKHTWTFCTEGLKVSPSFAQPVDHIPMTATKDIAEFRTE